MKKHLSLLATHAIRVPVVDKEIHPFYVLKKYSTKRITFIFQKNLVLADHQDFQDF
jgi:hypothetical protein